MRSDAEIAAEALRRAAVIREKRLRDYTRRLTAGAIAACLAFALCIALLTGGLGFEGSPAARAAATMLGGAVAGGYVLAGIAGFVLGVVGALFVKERRR